MEKRTIGSKMMSVPVKLRKKAMNVLLNSYEENSVQKSISLLDNLININGFNGNFRNSLEDIKTELVKKEQKMTIN